MFDNFAASSATTTTTTETATTTVPATKTVSYYSEENVYTNIIGATANHYNYLDKKCRGKQSISI